jgi:hypothetical protein
VDVVSYDGGVSAAAVERFDEGRHGEELKEEERHAEDGVHGEDLQERPPSARREHDSLLQEGEGAWSSWSCGGGRHGCQDFEVNSREMCRVAPIEMLLEFVALYIVSNRVSSPTWIPMQSYTPVGRVSGIWVAGLCKRAML